MAPLVPEAISPLEHLSSGNLRTKAPDQLIIPVAGRSHGLREFTERLPSGATAIGTKIRAHDGAVFETGCGQTPATNLSSCVSIDTPWPSARRGAPGTPVPVGFPGSAYSSYGSVADMHARSIGCTLPN